MGMFVGVFSHPRGIKHGCGKSVFCLKKLVRLYGGWEKAREFIVFTVDEFKQLLAKYESIKAVLWDDAGVWLGSSRKEVREFIAMIPDVKKRVEKLYFTAIAPSDLARGVRDALDYYVFIYRPLLLGGFDDIWKATAYIYDSEGGESMARGRYVDSLYIIPLDLFFDHYSEYEEMREKHVKMLGERNEPRQSIYRVCKDA